jgi:hypothetical protein
VHDGQIGAGEHEFEQAGDATEDVDADLDRLALSEQAGDLLDQAIDRRGRVVHPLTQSGKRLAGVRIKAGSHRPVVLLGHVDADGYIHFAPFTRSPVRLLPAVLALPSDGSQSLISGQKEAAGQAAKPPEPSPTAAL